MSKTPEQRAEILKNIFAAIKQETGEDPKERLGIIHLRLAEHVHSSIKELIDNRISHLSIIDAMNLQQDISDTWVPGEELVDPANNILVQTLDRKTGEITERVEIPEKKVRGRPRTKT